MRYLVRFIKDDSGATAIEYVMIAGLISIFVLIGVTSAGTSLTARFSNIGRVIP